jgi:hypothetical protein
MSPVSTNTAYVRCNILRLKCTLQIPVVSVHTSCINITNLSIFCIIYIILFSKLSHSLILAIKRPCFFLRCGNWSSRCCLRPFWASVYIVVFVRAVAGEGIWMKFGIRIHTVDLLTNAHFDLHRTVCDNHVFCFVCDGCNLLSICENEKMFRTEMVHIFFVFLIFSLFLVIKQNFPMLVFLNPKRGKRWSNPCTGP